LQNIRVPRNKVAVGPCSVAAGNQLFQNLNFRVFAVYGNPERRFLFFYPGGVHTGLGLVRRPYYQFDSLVVVVFNGYFHLVQAVGQAVITRFFAGGKEIIVSARGSAAESIVFEVFKQGGLAYGACNFLDRPPACPAGIGSLGRKGFLNIRIAQSERRLRIDFCAIARVEFRAVESYLYPRRIRIGKGNAGAHAQIEAVIVCYLYPYAGVGGEFIAYFCFAGIEKVFCYKTYSIIRLRVIVDIFGLFD